MFVLELSICVFCMAGFSFLFDNALKMPYPQSFWDGPGSFPAVLSAILFLICVYWLVDLFRSRKKAKARADETAEESPDGDKAALEAEKKKRERKSFITIGVLTVFYIMVLMPLIPFPAATFIYLTICFLLFSKGRWWKSLIISVCMSAVIYLIFTYVLHLPMPR